MFADHSQSNTQSSLFNPFRIGLLLAFSASLLFSMKTIFIKLAYVHGVDTVSFITLRMLFAAPFYLVVLALLGLKGFYRKLTLRCYTQVGILGLCSYYLASVLDLEGLHYIGANLERMILYTYPTLVLFLGALFLGRKIRLLQVFVILLAYAGLALIFVEDFNVASNQEYVTFVGLSVPAIIFGAGCVLLSALSYAVFVCFSENIIAVVGAKQFTALAMLAASLGVATHFMLSASLGKHSVLALLQLPAPVFQYALTVAFLNTVLPSFMLTEAIRMIGANNTGIVGMTGPVITLLAAIFILAEAVTSLQILGMGITLLAVFMLGKSKKGNKCGRSY